MANTTTTTSRPTSSNITDYVRTMWGGANQTASWAGLPYEIPAHTTLNEYFGVESDTELTSSQRPVMRYLVIGNRGHGCSIGADGSTEEYTLRHQPNDVCCWNHLPFLIRETDDDISSDYRQKYRLRTIIKVNGKNYIAYYAKVINFESTKVTNKEMVVKDQVMYTKEYIPTDDQYNVEPPKVSTDGDIIGSNLSYTSSAIVNLSLDANDIQEIIDAYRIMTGSRRAPTLSEIGLCSGADKNVSLQGGDSDSTLYTEVIACQVNVFVGTIHPLGYTTDGLDITLDIGAVEPYMADKSEGTGASTTQGQ